MIAPIPLSEALALSSEAGWNQSPGDWQRIFRLCGEACYAIRAEGRVVTTTSAITYGDSLAWIGMVLTTASQRGKGHARTLMQQALADLRAAGVGCIKLDATDLGRPVYAKLGFIDERPVSRWLRKPDGGPLPPAPDNVLASGSIPFALDREAFGADRSALLTALAEEELYTAPNGYAMAREGRNARYFGPCVAQDDATARSLLQAFLARHGHEPALLDLCDEHTGATAIATEVGFQPIRRLMRMYLGDLAGIPLGSGAAIYNLAGFEFG
ncbi:MAG: GNAT family N-acetyltransferase [Bryobacterales bacterium]|nr:GNAT family N-acetyltransferase [Bryobacterales bacterium]